jgi:hypothetical protein
MGTKDRAVRESEKVGGPRTYDRNMVTGTGHGGSGLGLLVWDMLGLLVR